MVRKIGTGMLIGLLYCFPYVYYSMYEDFTDGLMIGYLIMILATSILAFLGKLYSNVYVIVIGNLLSYLVSYYFIGSMDGNDSWGGYFKPLQPTELLLFVSILNLMPQIFALMLAQGIKKK